MFYPSPSNAVKVGRVIVRELLDVEIIEISLTAFSELSADRCQRRAAGALGVSGTDGWRAVGRRAAAAVEGAMQKNTRQESPPDA